MLHEVLLALSGHPSPLFDQDQIQSFPLLSPAERELLGSLAHLAGRHRSLKVHLSLILKEHASVICRAVASALQNRHLAAFQRHILSVEKQILASDSAHVGAYNIVPLAKVVASFSEWHRRLEWYWHLATFITPVKSPPNTPVDSLSAKGPALIDKLRQASSTGYPDIEEAASDLSRTAESTWLRLLSGWLLSGSTPDQNAQDLFLHLVQGKLVVEAGLVPEFLSPSAAASLLYIGKTLNHMDPSQMAGEMAPDSDKLTASRSAPTVSSRAPYVTPLASLSLPVSSVDITHAVAAMRALLSRQLTSTVLPVATLMEIVASLKDLFLAQRGHFAETLIVQADSYLRDRSGQIQAKSASSNTLAGIILRDSEAAKVLSNTWASMSAILRIDQTVDTQLEWARDNLLLRIGDSQNLHDAEEDDTTGGQLDPLPKNVFGSSLLSTPSALTLSLKSPLDLFLSRRDVQAYSLMNAYLVAIRRSLLHTANLWKQSQLRRGAVGSNRGASYKYRIFTSKKIRERACRRERTMRPMWATLTSAMFFLTELGEYLNAEVVTGSWHAFRAWFEGRDYHSRSALSVPVPRPETASSQSDTEASLADGLQELSGSLPSQGSMPDPRHDPELLSLAHRQYLSMLLETLLLTKEAHIRAISTLLIRLDQLVAMVLRLQTVQSNLDLHDEGVDDGFSDKYAAEEREVYADMRMASDKVKASVRHATEQLQTIDAAAPSLPAMPEARARTGFEPWNQGSIDRLLMRLDLKMSVTGNVVAT